MLREITKSFPSLFPSVWYSHFQLKSISLSLPGIGTGKCVKGMKTISVPQGSFQGPLMFSKNFFLLWVCLPCCWWIPAGKCVHYTCTQ